MTDTIDATAASTGTDPAAASAAAAPDPRDTELASLRSRNSGLNAKVTDLQKQVEALTGELGTARAGLTDKESADADLRAQLAEAQKSIATLTRTNEVNAIAAQYPEAFKELGEGIHGMKPETLASLEARLSGAAAPAAGEEQTETPRPVGNNPQRSVSGSKPIEDMTSEELRESLRTMPREAFGLASE